MSFSKHVVPRTDAKADVVGDRNHLIQVGMAAVWFTLLVFAVQRLVVALQTGLLTPWWGNAAGLVALTALWAWYRRRPQTRSSGAAHGTALIATITLLIPVAYGLTSTIWWLSLVGFAAVLLGRRQEAKVWGVTIPLVMVASVIAEPYVQIQGVAGELPIEAALAKIIFSVILIGMAVGFRRVTEQRALVLHDSEAESTEALQKSQGLLAQAEKMGKVGGWEFDIETKQQTWTETVYDIHELDSTGRPTVEQGVNYYTPASRPIIEQAMQRAIEQGEPFDLELEIITAKGNLRSVHVIGRADLARRKVSCFFQDITERKQAEKTLLQSRRAALNLMTDAVAARDRSEQMSNALRENEQKYRVLFETSEDAILLFAEGCWVDCNASALKIFGCTREQIIGANPIRFSPPMQPDGRSSEEEAIKKINLAFAVEPQFFEWEHCRADGAPFTAEVCLNRLDLGGKPYMQAIVRDVTGRKRAEKELTLNSQRMQVLLQLNQMREAGLKEITDFALEEAVRLTQSTIGYLAFLNEDESVLTMHSWSKSAMAECAIIDKPIIYPVVTTGLWGEAVRQRRSVFTNDYAADNPLKKGYPQGHVAVKRHMNVPVFEDSRIVLVAGVGNKNEEYSENDAQQLTLLMEGMWRLIERKKVGEELEKSEERYRKAQEMGHVGHWAYDPISNEFNGSPEANRIYGFPEDAPAPFEDIVDCISKAEVERVVQALFGLFKDGTAFNEVFEIHPRNSSETRVLHSVARMQKDEHGNPMVSGILQDITERKRAEEELRRHRENLEMMVAERTTQLSAANKELEAFSYSVSHDLRAPLRTIDGFSEALLEDYGDKLDDTGKTYLERVCKATQRMGFLIDDMLKLSRITQAEMKRGAVDLSGMVREITEAHQKSNPDRAVDVTVQEGVMVQGDPYLLKIAMENLVGNAFKFTGKEAHPRIEFGTAVRDGETACFIRDNGAGFDMAYVGKLFSAFQRLHATEEFPGTGIGLATVQRIIHRHGGQVWAKGEVGKGATFHLTLPL